MASSVQREVYVAKVVSGARVGYSVVHVCSCDPGCAVAAGVSPAPSLTDASCFPPSLTRHRCAAIRFTSRDFGRAPSTSFKVAICCYWRSIRVVRVASALQVTTRLLRVIVRDDLCTSCVPLHGLAVSNRCDTGKA